MIDWESIFVPSMPLLELSIRGTVTFLALLVMVRVVGQREAGGLGVTDLLVVILIADAASAGLTGDAATIADGLVLVTTILFWSVVVDAIAYRWPRLAAFVKARPRLLIEDGQLNHQVMRREFMTKDEVFSQLRLHGITDPNEVRRAYLEPNGMISVIRKDNEEPDEPIEHPAIG